MASSGNFLGRVVRATITNDRDLAVYVVCISAACLLVALAFDVTNQMLFFSGWPTALRSWTITAVVVLILAIPISRTMGKAYLELYRAKILVEEISRTDALTGLANRRSFMELVAQTEASDGVLALIDIDHFKDINDIYGHLAGDMVIRSVGQIMATELADLGRLSRVGGDEFAMLASATHADRLAAKLFASRDRLAATPIIAGGAAVRVTISAGLAWRRPGASFTGLYAEADKALYAAKAAGRNQIGFSPLFAARSGFGSDSKRPAERYGTAD